MNAPGTAALAQIEESKCLVEPHFPLPIIGNAERPRIAGKFLYAGEEKLWIKGVTYGTFRPQEDGSEFPPSEVVEKDFTMMAARGINSVRTYIPPPRWLLDLAQKHGLRVMVGLAWEQHVTFLDDRKLIKTIKGRIRDGVRACARHPAILCYTIGNEIPPSIVRWHGRKKIERFLKKLYKIAKSVDPDGLVTYVNFPTTEYLQLPFLDFVCFNVYLEEKEKLANYLARLQNLTDERPLVMAEIGLDSQRNGLDVQAESLDWQMRTAFEEGCAGTFVFAWTDEWYRGGHDIEDWDFGLTTRDREAKPALEAVTKTYADLPFPEREDWPKVSVVVCSYNGATTIRDTMDGLQCLEYPNFEVVVVNDGSTDTTPDIAAEYNVKLIDQENRGLSAARNTGWQNAEGEIVAYIDDDAYPDPHWLHYIVHTYEAHDFVGVGGPNIAPPGDGPIAECVYNAPGGPVAVLLTDREAEHVPGCNMTFKRSALEQVGGFDPRYRAAGDDVDICWRVQEQVGKIGYHAAAMDWHHRRNSLKMYWTQQKGYGKAEALLEEKWPEKYNAMGHFGWSGRLYGQGLTLPLQLFSSRVYGGHWGTALFQSLYQPAPGQWLSLPLMPEWYIFSGFLCLLSILGLAWPPLLWSVPALLVAAAAPGLQAIMSAAEADFQMRHRSRFERFKLKAITSGLHLSQPLARLIGRLKNGLSPWRSRMGSALIWRWSYDTDVWSENWRSTEEWLSDLTSNLSKLGAPVKEGTDFDSWDLQFWGGLMCGVRLIMATEEHGEGKQMVRWRVRPMISLPAPIALIVLSLLAYAAFIDGSAVVGLILTASSLIGVFLMITDYVRACTAFIRSADLIKPS